MAQLIDSFDFLSEEIMTKYAGKWVAVINGIIISGNSFKEVYEIVEKKYPKSKPLYGRIPEAVPVIFSIKEKA